MGEKALARAFEQVVAHDLNGNAARVLLHMARTVLDKDAKPKFWQGREGDDGLCSSVGMSRTQTTRAIRELVDAGLIVQTRTGRPGRAAEYGLAFNATGGHVDHSQALTAVPDGHMQNAARKADRTQPGNRAALGAETGPLMTGPDDTTDDIRGKGHAVRRDRATDAQLSVARDLLIRLEADDDELADELEILANMSVDDSASYISDLRERMLAHVEMLSCEDYLPPEQVARLSPNGQQLYADRHGWASHQLAWPEAARPHADISVVIESTSVATIPRTPTTLATTSSAQCVEPLMTRNERRAEYAAMADLFGATAKELPE